MFQTDIALNIVQCKEKIAAHEQGHVSLLDSSGLETTAALPKQGHPICYKGRLLLFFFFSFFLFSISERVRVRDRQRQRAKTDKGGKQAR